MTIGLIYGGIGAEEFSNIRAVKDIEKVLDRYSLKSRRVYLNDPGLRISPLKNIDLFFVIDSNCRDYSKRRSVFDYIQRRGTDFIIQDQKAFETAKNKFKSNLIFGTYGLRTPRSFLISTSQNFLTNNLINKCRDFFTRVGFPIIIKNNFGSSSEYLDVCFNEEQFFAGLKNLALYCQKILVEEYISGREITVPFIQLFGLNLVLYPVEIIYDGYVYDYKVKNRTFRNKLKIPLEVSKNKLREIRKITLMANELIGCRYYSRLDMKMQQNDLYILEINSEPVLAKNDFLARSAKSLGLSYAKLIIGLLSNSESFLSYAKSRNKKLLKFTERTKGLIARNLK